MTSAVIANLLLLVFLIATTYWSSRFYFKKRTWKRIIPLILILSLICIPTAPALWEMLSVRSSMEFFNLLGVLLLPIGALGITYLGYKSVKKQKANK